MSWLVNRVANRVCMYVPIFCLSVQPIFHRQSNPDELNAHKLLVTREHTWYRIRTLVFFWKDKMPLVYIAWYVFFPNCTSTAVNVYPSSSNRRDDFVRTKAVARSGGKGHGRLPALYWPTKTCMIRGYTGITAVYLLCTLKGIYMPELILVLT